MFETEEEKREYESWKNRSKGKVFLQKLDVRGQIKFEAIGPDRVFHITPKERRMNEEVSAQAEYNMFRNGTLEPIRLLDGTEDSAELANNPNHMSESDLRSLFKSDRALTKRLEELQNPALLQRLLELAEDETTDAKVKQVEAVRARLREVAPSLVDTQQVASEPERKGVVTTSTGGSTPGTGFKPATPR